MYVYVHSVCIYHTYKYTKCTCLNGLCMVYAYGECIGTGAGFRSKLHSVVLTVVEVTYKFLGSISIAV